ncbi:MAG TPA: lysophospholipid acyltransferase family protein [Vicinamibacterales bacterium]|jgi:glycerol-3-phosphate O-acyltransferase / dihydroxyacetone phosphate acyltransferase|nr:lysophospholipid acyltransferase family protein [Vicinamibacterales bacterium]
MPASPFVRFLARTACRLFYRVDRVGRPPESGAALLLPNHPNALLDPAVIWATADRDVRFLAKSTLFDGPLRFLVAGSGAIPVYRKLDQGVDVSKNTQTFAAVGEALAQGDAICIFPEGISHSTGRLVPLRTGAARMALSAEQGGTRVNLVPVGLNFERKTTFRSRVTVIYGQPFTGEDLADSRLHPDGVRELTDRMAAAMRRLLIEAESKTDAAIVERVDRMYAAARGIGRDPHERVERRRVIAAGIERLRAADPQRYDEILLRLHRYQKRLERFGLRDRHLDWTISTSDAASFAIREALAAIVLGPLAVAALIMFAVPYHLTGYAARWFTSEPDVAATAKVVGGFLVYTAWLVALGVAARLAGVPHALLLSLVLLPPLAVAGLFAIERESAVLDAVRAWWVLTRTRTDTRERLRRRRSELADVLDEVNTWLTERRENA